MKTKFWLLVMCVGPLTARGAEDWQIAWTRQLPQRAVAWSNTINMPRDSTYSMAVSEKLVIVGTTTDSALRAYDIATGQEQWRYAFSAPVRWAPVIAGDSVVAGSDDGTLVAINLADGKPRWRYVPGPGNAWCIGHERLVSLWPITTTPGIENGVVYGCAGAFVFDGVFIFAVDLKTGEERWLRRVDKRLSGAVNIETNLVSIRGYVVDAATGSPVAGAKVTAKSRAPDAIPIFRSVEKSSRNAGNVPQPDAGPEDPTNQKGQIIQSRVFDDRSVCLTSGNQLIGLTKRAPAQPVDVGEPTPQPVSAANDQSILAKALAEKCDAGWVLVAGLKDGRLVTALAAEKFHRVIAIDTDPARLAAVRAALQKDGTLSGNRVQIVQAPLADLPPWVFSLIVTEQEQPVDAKVALRKLRPFGGVVAIAAGSSAELRKLEAGL
ncbi:MAG: PQQ-binding-like beta-propeller repeat protein, partial [Thermoguttaceae bacterium]